MEQLPPLNAKYFRTNYKLPRTIEGLLYCIKELQPYTQNNPILIKNYNRLIYRLQTYRSQPNIKD